MRLRLFIFSFAGLLLTMATDCRSPQRRKTRYDEIDGGYIQRKECEEPSMKCHYDCVDREASITCTGCCRDQDFLCDTQQNYSYESCKSTQ